MLKETDKETIKLLKQGNELAFSDIYTKYKPALISFIRSLIKVEEIAEDISQQIFLSLWINRKDIDVDKSFSSYLFTIAKNNTLNYIRKDNSGKQYLKAMIWDEIFTGRCFTDEKVEHDELLSTINEAINSLTDQKRKIFEMSRKFGKSHDDIATELNISKNTVKNHITESTKLIKNHISSKESFHSNTILLLLWLFS